MKRFITILIIGCTIFTASANIYAREFNIEQLKLINNYKFDFNNNICNTITTEAVTEATTEITTNTIEITTETITNEQNIDYIQQVLNLVNEERAKVKLNPLTINNEVGRVAQIKAQDMMNNNYFSHTSPNYGTPFQMLNNYGIKYNYAGENIAKGQKTPESVVAAWMNSEGHKANILNPKYTQIGIGYAKSNSPYWVQIFVG